MYTPVLRRTRQLPPAPAAFNSQELLKIKKTFFLKKQPFRLNSHWSVNRTCWEFEQSLIRAHDVILTRSPSTLIYLVSKWYLPHWGCQFKCIAPQIGGKVNKITANEKWQHNAYGCHFCHDKKYNFGHFDKWHLLTGIDKFITATDELKHLLNFKHHDQQCECD